jgi:hypothetical protein
LFSPSLNKAKSTGVFCGKKIEAESLQTDRGYAAGLQSPEERPGLGTAVASNGDSNRNPNVYRTGLALGCFLIDHTRTTCSDVQDQNPEVTPVARVQPSLFGHRSLRLDWQYRKPRPDATVSFWRQSELAIMMVTLCYRCCGAWMERPLHLQGLNARRNQSRRGFCLE